MNDHKWEVGETYKTRGGWDAVVLSLDGVSVTPIVVKHFNDAGETVLQHFLGGIFHDNESRYDLMPPIREFFVVYGDDGWYGSNPDKKSAFALAASCKGKVIRFIEDREVTE